jgi:hypothetical protein
MLVSLGRKLRSAKLSKLFYSFIFFPFVFNVLKKFMIMDGDLSDFNRKQVARNHFFFFFFFQTSPEVG